MKLQTIFIQSFSLFAAIQSVRGSTQFFDLPKEGQTFDAGSNVDFQVNQLPNVEGKTLQAQVFADGKGGEKVVTIDSWDRATAETEQDDFKFSWQIPNNMKSGRYYVKMVQGEEGVEDDNDPVRSFSFNVKANPQYTNPQYQGGGGGYSGNGGYSGGYSGGNNGGYNNGGNRGGYNGGSRGGYNGGNRGGYNGGNRVSNNGGYRGSNNGGYRGGSSGGNSGNSGSRSSNSNNSNRPSSQQHSQSSSPKTNNVPNLTNNNSNNKGQSNGRLSNILK